MNILAILKPKNQTQEALYMLIKYHEDRGLTRSDFFNYGYILNAPAAINRLRRKGVDIETKMNVATNKFGRRVRYSTYKLLNLTNAIKQYRDMAGAD